MSLRDIPIDAAMLNPEESTSQKTILSQEVLPAGDQLRCKICFETSRPLVSCCQCTGSIGHVHQNCLLEWMAHCIEKNGYAVAPRCEICKAHISATITVSRPEFSIMRFLTAVKDKKALLCQVVFSLVAMLLACLHFLLFLISFTLSGIFIGAVLPAFVGLHSARFLANLNIWNRCFVQVVEVTLDPYDVIR